VLFSFLILNVEKMNLSSSKKFIIILIVLSLLPFLLLGFVSKNNSFFIVGIIIFISSLIIYCQIYEHYSQNDEKLKELKLVFEKFFAKQRKWEGNLEVLNKKDIMKEITLYRGEKSYTINKEKVYICLKDPQGEYYNDNTLYYVIAHEISHAICDEIGHTDKFHAIFKELLILMEKDGIYNSSIPIQQDYCTKGDKEM